MAFRETTVLSTREPAFGSRRLGQIMPVPTGRLDKVSLYLEPKISDTVAAESIDVKVEIFIVDSQRIPTGLPVASQSVALSEIKSRGLFNFRLETVVPPTVAVVLSTMGATSKNHVAWRYVSTPAAEEELLISEDDGISWSQDPNRKFSFIAYSIIDDVTDVDDQSVEIQAGERNVLSDDTAAEFSLSELTRATVVGDTVVINFGDFVVTLVVDMSGSMTWNDNEGLRFDFLNDYIDDMESSLPPSSSAEYSLVKFRSRKIGSLDTIVQTSVTGAFIEGVRIVRKVGSVPTSPSDGLVIFEGFSAQFEDRGLTSGTFYNYGIFVLDSEGNFSEGRFDSAIPQSPPTPPLTTASLRASEVIDLVGDFDTGRRLVKLTWIHPESLDYNKITLVRRDDRAPETASDGTVVFTDTGGLLSTSFTDFDPDSIDRADHAITGLTYYYGIFTENTVTGLKALGANARKTSIRITTVDRVWEKAEPPFDVPPAGFDDVPPLPPTSAAATPSPGELLLAWTAGNADNRRYQIFFKPDEFPRQENVEDGSSNFDGEKIFDGTETSFVHRGLDNDEPHFYVIVSLDEVSNQSTSVSFTGVPDADADPIPPDPVIGFSAEVVNSTDVLLTWMLDIDRITSIEAFFGDTVRLTGVISFEDANPRTTFSELIFVEESRVVRVFNDQGSPVNDDEGLVDSTSAITFDQAPATDTNAISADVSVISFTSIQNLMSEATITVHPSIQVKKRSTGDLITEVVGRSVNIKFKNPFGLSIQNDPPQSAAVRQLSLVCDLKDSPSIDITQVPGVFAKSGESFYSLLEAQFREEALSENINLSVRILDANSGLVTSRLRLPETGSDGTAVLTTSNELDEIIDRTGNPTGETLERSIIRITLPPQDNPGEYILEVTGKFEGFSRTVQAQVVYVSSLNIDVKAKAFNPNGVDIAEQEAFAYFGSPLASDEDKIAVPELTVTNWELTKVAGGGPPIRPFFSRDSVPGTGVKAFARAGIVRNIFLGPGTDIEPALGATCTTGELYSITVTTEALGMEGTGYGLVELQPFVPEDLKAIFLRLSKDQVDEFGNDVETTKLASYSIFSDGTQESAWEIVARPEEDTETGVRSGVSFRDSLVAGGGLVPSLEDGTIVSIVVSTFSDEGLPSDVTIRTDLTGSAGRPASAKATVIGGKAKFYLKGNFLTTGTVKEPPLLSEAGNPIFSVGNLLWVSSSRVFSISVHTVLEVNGRPAIFSGGGANLDASTPPAYLSFIEPLEIQDPEGS